MSRERVLTDAQWERIAPLMPSSEGVKSRPFRDHRQVVEGVIYRFRTGFAWRDLPASFGPWQTVWKRHLQHQHGLCRRGFKNRDEGSTIRSMHLA